MKKIIFNLLALCLGALVVVYISSCRKEKVEISESMQKTVDDDATAEKMFDDAYNCSERYTNNAKSSMEDSAACLSITSTGSNYPKTVTIDFGSGCEINGIVRKGKIIVVTSQQFTTPGATRTITFEDYYVNGFKIEGTKTVVNKGVNDKGQPVREVTLKNGKITTPEGKTIEREFTRTRTWIEGYSTPFRIIDDVWSITGTTTGKNSEGKSFTATIKEPLIVAANCRFIKSGTCEIKTEDETLTIDFGDGSCDRFATITLNGESKTINLRNW